MTPSGLLVEVVNNLFVPCHAWNDVCHGLDCLSSYLNML